MRSLVPLCVLAATAIFGIGGYECVQNVALRNSLAESREANARLLIRAETAPPRAALLLSQQARKRAEAANEELREKVAGLEKELSARTAAPAAATSSTAPETEKRIVKLPEDGDQWWTILWLDPNWQKIPNQRRAATTVSFDKGCRDLFSRTKGKIRLINEPGAELYWRYVRATPALTLQSPDGAVQYVETNPDLGKRPRELLGKIEGAMRRRRHHCDDRDGVCPAVTPEKPQPAQPENPQDMPQPASDAAQEPQKKTGISAGAAVACFAGVAVLALSVVIVIGKSGMFAARVARGYRAG